MIQLNEKAAAESTFLTVKDRITNIIELIVSPAKFQVGLLNNPADLTIFGRTSLSTKKYTFDKSQKIEIESYVTIAAIITTSAVISPPRPSYLSVYLPSSPRHGQIVIVKDYSGTCGLVPIRIFDPSESQIDGSSYQQINSNYGRLTFAWNDVWFNIS